MIRPLINYTRIILLWGMLLILSGCEAISNTNSYVESIFHEEVVFFYTSTSYPGELTDYPSRDFHQSTLVFGPYMPNIGGIGAFFGSMIRASVSRQREFLADASAVQFTRNPNGIAGALKRIGG